MTMRSDKERDLCIDDLLARLQALEQEVARLKGAQVPEPAFIKAMPEIVNTSEEPVVSEKKRWPPPRKKAGDSLENTIGTRWIGRIGILLIIFGVAFFLKFSFDNRYIGETGRIILGIFWGAAFIGAGEYFQKKKALGLYGQILSGGGLAVLYLSLYAAFALYHLIPATLAAAAMIAVTSTGITLAVRYSAYSLATVSLFGGFLTPVMLSTGQNQPVVLFGYVLLLDAGIILLLRFRSWPSLAAASLFGTILLYAGWHSEFYTISQQWLAFSILVVFFALYNLYILIFRLYLQRAEAQIDVLIVSGSAAFFFLGFFAQHFWQWDWPVKVFCLSLAAVEIGMAELARRRSYEAGVVTATFAAASMTMTVAATFAGLEQRWILPTLAAEMAAFGWVGLKLNIRTLRFGAYLLGLIVLGRFILDVPFHLEPFERFIPVFNGRFLGCLGAVAGFYALVGILARYRDVLAKDEGNALNIAFVLSQILSLVLLSVEIHDFFRFRSPGHFIGWGNGNYAYQLSLSVLWAIYAASLTGIGILRKIREARLFGIALLGLTVLKVFFMDLSELPAFYRIISFMVLGLLSLAVSYGYNRFKPFIFGDDK